MTPNVRHLVAAFSLANLCLFGAWQRLFDRMDLYLKATPPALEVAAILLHLTCLGGILLAAWTAACRARRKWWLQAVAIMFLLLLSIPITGVKRLLLPELAILARVPIAAWLSFSLISFGILAWIAKRRQLPWDRLPGFAIATLLVCSPFLAVTVARSAWLVSTAGDPPPAATETQPTVFAGPRVLWIVFDEMSYEPAFRERPRSLELPAFDALRAQSIFATNAEPPSNATLYSIPAYLTGRAVTSATARSRSDLELTTSESDAAQSWSSSTEIFSRTREAGGRTALAGWYHPYCRVLTSALDACVWHPLYTFDYGGRFTDILAEQLRLVVDSAPAARHLDLAGWLFGSDRVERQRHRDAYARLLAAGREFVSDPAVGFAFVHLPIPHRPIIYNRRTEQIAEGPPGSYLDNLALADRALGELREAMTAAGLWDSTTVLVTSDHGWRGSARNQPGWTVEDEQAFATAQTGRVPWLLKLPGQTDSYEYAEPLPTVVSHGLLLAIMRREVQTPADVRLWLEDNAREN